MRGKHAAPPLLATAPRRVLGGAAAALALLVIAASAYALDRGPAPSSAAPPVPVDPVGAEQPAVSPSVSAASKPAKERATPVRTRNVVAPSPRPTAPRAPESSSGGLTARYVVSGSWDTGFVAGVVVFNPTGEPQPWRVEISHAASAEVQVVTHWNADITRSGRYVFFAGGPVPPGGTQTFGFEAVKKPTSRVRPTGCTVNGVVCEVAE